MSISTMSGPQDAEDGVNNEDNVVIEEKKMFVGFPHIRRPVLHESDHDTIWEESGRQVHARTREHQGSIKLLLKAPSTCDDDTLVAASERAIGFIEYNHAHPPPIVRTKAKTKLRNKSLPRQALPSSSHHWSPHPPPLSMEPMKVAIYHGHYGNQPPVWPQKPLQPTAGRPKSPPSPNQT